ncbi:cation-translocating P-type ATPase [Nitrospira sp. Kam-Ns4a]
MIHAPSLKPVSWHTMPPDAVVRELASDLDRGLSEQEAARRLAVHGPNELPEAPPASPWSLFLAQFSSLIVWVLIGAAVVSGLLQEWIDAGAILAIVLLNAILGFVQEFKAERSLAALKRLSVATARVVRDGTARAIPAQELVPGDVILIEAGDYVPADARLSYAAALRTQEAALTGESTPVDKAPAVLAGDDLPVAERRNMVFMSTVVAAGKGRALVVATGLNTELGRIATMLQTAEPEATPLQRRLEQLGHLLLYVSLGVVAVVFALGLWRGEPLVGMFLTSVSLAVAAIPEGLPAIVTITLALGVTRMVARHALIRRLPAVETLGSTTVICTDKTGTLTKNEMTVTRLFVDGRAFEVTGEGYAPEGEIRPLAPSLSPAGNGLRELLTAAVLCNGATLRQVDGVWQVLGDPTEGALLVAAAKLGLWKESLGTQSPVVGEIPFDPERKMMTVIRHAPGGITAFVKGAPDVLIERCTWMVTVDGAVEPLDESARRDILEANRGFAHEALRVLGVARRQLEDKPADLRAAEIEQALVFLGLIAMKDPLRPEAVIAVRQCRQAGIRTVMITGDHKETAVAIAKDLGLVNGRASALAGTELDALSDQALTDRVEQVVVYARVSAEHKLRIVRAWKARGAVVAMTGDGVNDAPAIKAADIGVAMGLSGTDVTKEASDMVITDDNFASIAAAVEEGRAIYDNIRKSVHYLLSCNLSEVLLMLLATLSGLPLPLLPVQILWINLVTDGFPALALAADPKDPDIMHRPPRDPKARFLSRRRLLLLLGQGTLIAASTMLVFAYCLFAMDQSLERARTVTFTVMVLAQLFHAFNCRSDRRSVFSIGVFSNRSLIWAVGGSAALQVLIVALPAAREVFKVSPFDPKHWMLVMAVGLVPLLAMELWKAIRWRRDS